MSWVSGYADFFPPLAVGVEPPFLPDDDRATKQFYGHYKPTDRYVNVYALSDGTFVQDYATAENSNVAIPMPLDPVNAGSPYSTIYINTHNPPTIIKEVLPVFVTTVYYGGRKTRVDPGTAERLSAAGYNANLTPAT